MQCYKYVEKKKVITVLINGVSLIKTNFTIKDQSFLVE